MAKVEFLSAGLTTLWTVPEGVTSVIIECYGGGGAGGSVSYINASTGGGGGGAYAKKTMAVSPGLVLRVKVASYTSYSIYDNVVNGNPSSVENFGGTILCLAPGGLGGDISLAGNGTTVGAVGDVIYQGGNGAFRVSIATGAGGGCAGKYGAGGNAIGQTGGLGNDEYSGNGAGGASWTSYVSGNNGNIYGGGGSGARSDTTSIVEGGSGASGAVIISYEEPSQNHFFLL
jgi:hypothetical protein